MAGRLNLNWSIQPCKAVGHLGIFQTSVIHNNIGQGMNNIINEAWFSALCDQAAQIPNLHSLLSHSLRKYKTNFTQETPTFILEQARRVNEREGKKEVINGKIPHQDCWAFGERKIFCWALMALSHLSQVTIQSMKQNHILALHAIFQQKSIDFIYYEVTLISRSHKQVKEPWSEQEVLLLSRIVEQTRGKHDWRAVSFQLFVETKRASFKALQECREKWCNYLNPNLKREGWSLEEDRQLFELVEKEGCRWALISRCLTLKRTEHMVKNRYNTYLRNWKNKRTTVKTKKGLAIRILSYLRTRINSKIKRQQQRKDQSLSDTPHSLTQQPEHFNEYSGSQQSQSYYCEEQEAIFRPKKEGAAREAYIEEKKEKKTADCETPMGSVNAKAQSVGEQDRGFNLQMIMGAFDGLEFKSGKEEMRLIEDEVVRALGCSHFERALEPYQFEVYEDCDSLSWLI